MPRVAPRDLDELDPSARAHVEAKEAAGSIGVPRIEAHLPEVQRAVDGVGRALMKHGTLSPRLFELVRLRIAFHNQCRTCMSMRYGYALDDGLTEGVVCSLERPDEATDLSASERAALRFADLFATDHLAIDETVYDELREYFDEAQLVELGYLCAISVGFGRLAATWDVKEHLPAYFRDGEQGAIAPWGSQETVEIGRRR